MDTPSSASKQAKSFHWLGVIAFILSTAALVAIVLSWAQLHHLQSKKSHTDAVQTAEQQQALSTISQLQTQVQAQQQTIDSLESHLGHSAFRLKLTQIAAQLNLANLQLTMNDNIDGALIQLKHIETSLTGQRDSRLLSLQRAIHSDMTRLQDMHTQDTPRILSQIDDLSQAVQNAHFIPQPITHTTPPKHRDKDSNWSTKLWLQLKQAKQLVVIRHHGPGLRPLLDPTQQEILRTLIQGRLLLCEYAVIHRNDALFHQQLSQIKDWLQTLMLDSTTKDALLNRVKALQEVSLHSLSINLDTTIDLLNGIMTSDQPTSDTATIKQPAQSPPSTPPKTQTGIAI